MGEVSPQSRRLAEHVQQELVTGMPREYRPVADLGVKKGPFYVLFLSSMPSVLVESASSPTRRRRSACATTATSNALAEQIAEGLSAYRGATQPRSPRGRRERARRPARRCALDQRANEVAARGAQLPRRGARAPARAARARATRAAT